MKVILIFLLGIIFFIPSALSQTSESAQKKKLEEAAQHYICGRQFLQKGDFIKADEEFRKAEKILESIETKVSYVKREEEKPENPDIYYNQAIAYLKRSQFLKARDAFEKVIQLNPKDKDAYYNLGILYECYFRDKKRALECYKEYLKLSPQAPDSAQVRSWIKENEQ